MSLQNPLKDLGVVQEVLVIGLMFVMLFSIFFVDIDFTLKIGIVILSFIIIFLSTLATQILRQAKEAKNAQNK